MNIFENLEQLNVSEECYNDIIGITEEIINEVSDRLASKLLTSRAYNYGVAAGKGSEDHDELRNKFLRTKKLYMKRNERKKPEDREYEGDIYTKYTRAFSTGVSKGEELKECYEDIIGILEDLLGTTQKNLADASDKYNKYVDRIKKVLKNKKENGTLNDLVRDKAWGMVYTGKYAKELEKARELADKAENLHRVTYNYPDDYYQKRKQKI